MIEWTKCEFFEDFLSDIRIPKNSSKVMAYLRAVLTTQTKNLANFVPNTEWRCQLLLRIEHVKYQPLSRQKGTMIR